MSTDPTLARQQSHPAMPSSCLNRPTLDDLDLLADLLADWLARAPHRDADARLRIGHGDDGRGDAGDDVGAGSDPDVRLAVNREARRDPSGTIA